MRLGWRIGLPGPFYLGGTIWRSRRRGWHGTLPDGWKCHHQHRSQEAAVECAQNEERRRGLTGG